VTLAQLQQRFPGAREFDLREAETLCARVASLQRSLDRVHMIQDARVRAECAAVLNQLDGAIVDAVAALVSSAEPGAAR
jgi:hypothetical protein